MKTKATAIAAFVESDEKAKTAAATPAGAWPFPTTINDLTGAKGKTTSPVKAAPKRATTAEKAANKAAAKEYKGEIAFNVRGSGARFLFAHTAAWLELTGLIHGKSAPVELIRKVGGSAYSHHYKQGNFTAPHAGMVELTAKGMTHFRAREDGSAPVQVDQGLKENYMLMMMSGVSDGHAVMSDNQIVAL